MAEKRNITLNKIDKGNSSWWILLAVAVVVILIVAGQPSLIFGATDVSDADTLDGFDSSHFATKDEINGLTPSSGYSGGGGGGSSHVTTVDDTDWNETNSDWIALNNASYTMVRIGGGDPPTKNLTIDSGSLTTEAFILVRLGSSNRFLKMGNDGSDDSIISWDDSDDLVFRTYTIDSSELGGTEVLRLTDDGKLQQTGGGVSWNMYVNATGVLVWEIA